ncbi:MAG TPA: DEAD/DEAH box helicase [Candidatus Babeliales bacterium]|nr:DEAD/DEAH box helicase [Candidatus Babeliales bacterium]
MKTFNDFPINSLILAALSEQGFTTPTQIQEKAFAHLLSKDRIDFHGQAQTGTGKTLAFGIPLIQSIDPSSSAVQGLIVAPTRELVLQIAESLQSVARNTGCTIVTVYGGVSIERQMQALRGKAHIVVGTPGRLNDHIRRRTLSLKGLKTLVLDEADIMLDMGFKEEVDEILANASYDRQIWLFSATVKPGITAIKKQYMKDPVIVQASREQVGSVNTQQFYCVVPTKYKLQALVRFIDSEPEFYGIVFCRTKILAAEIAQELGKKGYSARALHGDINQTMRNSVIAAFKAKKFSVLVATDVAARGIDVDSLSHVVNYCIPDDQESYVHRVGRTGRAGKQGVAITFAGARDVRRMQAIGNRFNMTINQIEVPSIESIAQVRLEKVKNYVTELIEKNLTPSIHTEKLTTLLEQYTPTQRSSALHALLYTTILQGVDEQKDISFAVEKSTERSSSGRSRGGDFSRDRDFDSDKPRRGGRSSDRRSDDGGSRDGGGRYEVDPNSKEIMVHAGSLDGVTKSDLIQFLTQSRAVTNDAIGKIRIIQKRSFVHVPTKVVPALLQQLKSVHLCGKKVRVNIAQR